MSFQGLQNRLSALQETTAQLRDLVDRLASLRFQPGSVPLDVSEEDSVSGELSGEISRLLKQGEEDAELLGEEAEYLRLEEEREDVKEGVARVQRELKRQRSAFTRAKLTAKKNLALAQRQERELILQSYSQPPSEPLSPTAGEETANDDGSTAVSQQQPALALRHHHRSNLHQHQQLSALSEDDKHTVGASANVTNALRRTHDLIASELERSEFARQTLEESSAALKGLSESYGSLDDMLAGTRKLLGTLVKSQKSDTWYLQTTFWMLAVTAGWLLFRRLLYGPAMLLVWWPLRILFGVGSKAVQVTTSTGGKKGAEVGQQGKASVDGLPGEDLPTMKVGKDTTEGTGAKDEVREQVEKMIDKANEAEELGSIPKDDVEQPVVDGEAHVRDEL